MNDCIYCMIYYTIVTFVCIFYLLDFICYENICCEKLYLLNLVCTLDFAFAAKFLLMGACYKYYFYYV